MGSWSAMRFALILVSSCLATSCTTYVETKQLSSEGGSQNAVGLGYSLPEIAFDTTTKVELKACDTAKTGSSSASNTPSLSENNRNIFDVEVSAVSVLVADSKNRYVIDFEGMGKPMVGTNFSVDFHPSGAIKSINSVVKDETASVFGDVVKGYIAVQTGGLSLSAQQIAGSMEKKSPTEPTPSKKKVSCTSATLANLSRKGELESQIKKFELLTSALRDNTRLLANEDNSDLENLCVQGLGTTPTCAKQTINACKAFDKQDSIVSCRDRVLDTISEYSEIKKKELSKLVQEHLTITFEKRVLPKWETSTKHFERPLVDLNGSEVLGKWFDSNGVPDTQENKIMLVVSAEKASRCDVKGNGYTPGEQKLHGTVKGIAYRMPALTHMVVLHRKGGVKCMDQKLLLDEHILLPQAGDIVVMPVFNKRLENKTLSMTFSEIGVPLTFKYISKAEAKEISSSLLGTAESVQGYRAAKKQSEIGDLSFEKELVEAKKELLDAKAELMKSEEELEELTNDD